jgi:kynureninase
VTVAEAVVLSCFDLRGERRRIVYEEENFPSVRYLQQSQEARGAEVVVCRDEEEIVAAIDERTLLVPISHVIFKTGRIQDVEPIIERAHEVGAHVVLDAYQSVGSVPLDVTALNVDFAVGGSVKWLCGGPGAGWLYVRPTSPSRRADARRLSACSPFGFEPELSTRTARGAS